MERLCLLIRSKVRRCINVIVAFWVNNFGRWFSYYKVLRTAYDFDYSSILEVEKHQMIRVRDSIIKADHYKGWEHDVSRINLALKLLDIAEDGGAILVDSELIITNNGYCQSNNTWDMPIYVNTKNYKRFLPYFTPERFTDPKVGALHESDLREQKAWYLYHKLRMYNLRRWWW